MQELSHRQTNTSMHSEQQPNGSKQKDLQPNLQKQQPEQNNADNQQKEINMTRNKTWFSRICPCLTIQFFQQYFDITTLEIRNRLLTSLIPFNKKFITMYKEKPDLYGPFWIYTTLIIIVAISGNLSRYFEMGHDKFAYNFNFIPVAATIIYSLGFGLPFLLKVLMRFMGSNFFSGTFIEILGIYAYSFTSFLITTLLCAIPIQGLQWAFIVYSALTSTGFLMVTFWNDLKEALEPKRRLLVIGFICGVQVMFLLIFKLYFFKNVKDTPQHKKKILRRASVQWEKEKENENKDDDSDDSEINFTLDEYENDQSETFQYVKSFILYAFFALIMLYLITKFKMMELLMYTFLLLFTFTNFIYHLVQDEEKKRNWNTLFKSPLQTQEMPQGTPQSEDDFAEMEKREMMQTHQQDPHFSIGKWTREYVCLIALFLVIAFKDRFNLGGVKKDNNDDKKKDKYSTVKKALNKKDKKHKAE